MKEATRDYSIKPDGYTLLLNGKFNEESLPDLDRLIEQEQTTCIDLSEVTLVDRAAARYFSLRAADGIKFVNCPAYLRQWIPHEVE